MPEMNLLGQPVGHLVKNWMPRPPPTSSLLGRFCRLERLNADAHAQSLYEANSADSDGRMWTYMPYGPFASVDEYREWVMGVNRDDDPLFVAVVELRSSLPIGVGSFMRIDRSIGLIEIGHIAFSPRLQRTTAATEAIYLMLRNVFELGYRRCEWRCDVLNAPSRQAALRFGFTYEGTLRHANIVKGRNRDTAWFSIIDADWAQIESAFARWLADENFDGQGRQRLSLSSLRAAARGRTHGQPDAR
jgi:RimJ/RimL family protein N-acetyltransferase